MLRALVNALEQPVPGVSVPVATGPMGLALKIAL
jgi:hypothetical protein